MYEESLRQLGTTARGYKPLQTISRQRENVAKEFTISAHSFPSVSSRFKGATIASIHIHSVDIFSDQCSGELSMYIRFFALGGGALRALLVVAPLTVAATDSLRADSFERISEAGVTHKQTVWKSNGELATELTSCPIAYTTILSVTVPKVDAGQTLSIDADMEATNPNIPPILLSTYVTINGTGVDDPQGSNVTSEMHHIDVTRAAFWQSTADLKNVVVQLVARACSDTIGPGQVALQVEQGYGIVFAKVN